MQKVHYTKVGVLVDNQGHPYNPRGYPGDTTELQEQIRRDGQRTPMRVTLPNEKDVRLVTRGHRRKAAIDALRTEARQRMKHAIESKRSQEDIDREQAEVEQFSYYLVEVGIIDPNDLSSIIADMDAGIIQEAVNPVALGEAIMYRMDNLGWSFDRCAGSLGLNHHKARLCLRAADPKQTAESVRKALKSGEISLNLFDKKLSKLDRITQDVVMDAAQTRTEGSKRGHGVVNSRTVNSVIEELTVDAHAPELPDTPVLPLLAAAKENILKALELRDQWSAITEDMAAYHLDEIAGIIRLAIQEDVREAQG